MSFHGSDGIWDITILARPTSFLNLSHIPVPLILPFSWPVGAEEAAVVRVRVRSQLRTRHNPSSYALKDDSLDIL